MTTPSNWWEKYKTPATGKQEDGDFKWWMKYQYSPGIITGEKFDFEPDILARIRKSILEAETLSAEDEIQQAAIDVALGHVGMSAVQLHPPVAVPELLS